MNAKCFTIIFYALFYTYLVCGSSVNDSKKNDTDPTLDLAAVTVKVPAVDANSSPKKDIGNNTLKSSNDTSLNGRPEKSAHPTLSPVEQPTTTQKTSVTLSDSITNVSHKQSETTKITPSMETTKMPELTAVSTTPSKKPELAIVSTTLSTTSTTEHPTTESVTIKLQEVVKDRKFDGPSFIGGTVLALGLTGIGFVAYKFCKPRVADGSYRNF